MTASEKITAYARISGCTLAEAAAELADMGEISIETADRVAEKEGK